MFVKVLVVGFSGMGDVSILNDFLKVGQKMRVRVVSIDEIFVELEEKISEYFPGVECDFMENSFYFI